MKSRRCLTFFIVTSQLPPLKAVVVDLNGINTANTAYCNSVQNILQYIYRWNGTEWDCPTGESEIIGASIFKGNFSVLNDIYMNTDTSLWIGSHSDSGKRLRLHQNNNGNVYIDYADENLFIRSGAGEDPVTTITATSDSRVGIGTTPGSIDEADLTLDVNGYAGFNGLRVGLDGCNDILSQSPNGLTLTASDSSGNMQFRTGGNASGNIQMTITSQGNVGIGTTSANTRLHVNGAVTLGGTDGPRILNGSGIPTALVPNGSLYLRTDGTGPNLYVRQNGGWVSK